MSFKKAGELFLHTTLKKRQESLCERVQIVLRNKNGQTKFRPVTFSNLLANVLTH